MATNLLFSDFSNVSQLQLNGHATKFTNGIDLLPVLRLTDTATTFDVSSVFSKTTIGASAFSSFFEFRITDPGGYPLQKGGDGLAFVIQAVSDHVLGARGGAMGYQGITNSISIVFDTYSNSDCSDPSGNYVGIDINGNVKHPVPATYVQDFAEPFKDGNLWYCWVDFNGTRLEVRANQTGIRPATPAVAEDLNLVSILGQTTAYVGFTAATGMSWENHDIVTWKLLSNGPIVGNDGGASGVKRGSANPNGKPTPLNISWETAPTRAVRLFEAPRIQYEKQGTTMIGSVNLVMEFHYCLITRYNGVKKDKQVVKEIINIPNIPLPGKNGFIQSKSWRGLLSTYFDAFNLEGTNNVSLALFKANDGKGGTPPELLSNWIQIVIRAK